MCPDNVKEDNIHSVTVHIQILKYSNITTDTPTVNSEADVHKVWSSMGTLHHKTCIISCEIPIGSKAIWIADPANNSQEQLIRAFKHIKWLLLNNPGFKQYQNGVRFHENLWDSNFGMKFTQSWSVLNLLWVKLSQNVNVVQNLKFFSYAHLKESAFQSFFTWRPKQSLKQKLTICIFVSVENLDVTCKLDERTPLNSFRQNRSFGPRRSLLIQLQFHCCNN